MKFFLSILLFFSVAFSSAQDARYKVGQMLVVGFKGSSLDEYKMRLLTRHFIGGVVLFDKDVSNKMGERNVVDPTQLKEFIYQMKRLSPDLLISIDQEGGRVARLRPSRGFERSVTAQYLGQLDNADSTEFYANSMAKELRDLGVNVNFAPCVDLNSNPKNPIIGGVGRSFGATPEEVLRHARVMIDEHHKCGILTSLKHFPGHGSSKNDSHQGFTDITSTFDTVELEPYKTLINEGRADIVMVGHLFNSNYDTIYPASLSKPTIDLLRKQMGYNGVVATDDMNMGAITNNFSYVEALKQAINAGVDMIIIGNNGKEYVWDLPEKTISSILKLIQDGEIPMQRIDEAYQRIRALKTNIPNLQ